MKIVHCVERHEITSQGELARKEDAWRSWAILYAVGCVPVHYWRYRRDSRDIGDDRGLPFLKDVLEAGLTAIRSDDDVCILTNDDAILHPQLLQEAVRHVAVHEAGACQRVEWKTSTAPDLCRSPAQLAKANSVRHPGRDAFVFSRSWLAEHLKILSDFVLGAQRWDSCLLYLMRHEKGLPFGDENARQLLNGCDLPLGLVLHRQHQPPWEDAAKRQAAASVHNCRLYENWMACHASPAIAAPSLKRDAPI